MNNEMRAVVIHAPGEFTVETVPVPKPGRGEVLVEVKSVAICGSDPGIFNGKVLQNGWPPYYPFSAGHEFAAQVVEVGDVVLLLELAQDLLAQPPGSLVSRIRGCRHGCLPVARPCRRDPRMPAGISVMQLVPGWRRHRHMPEAAMRSQASRSRAGGTTSAKRT